MFADHAIAPKQLPKKRVPIKLWNNPENSGYTDQRFQTTALRTAHTQKLQTWRSFLKRQVQEV
jgi:hypothetical protein